MINETMLFIGAVGVTFVVLGLGFLFKCPGGGGGGSIHAAGNAGISLIETIARRGEAANPYEDDFKPFQNESPSRDPYEDRWSPQYSQPHFQRDYHH